MHAVQKMLAAHSRPVRSAVDAGEFLEIEPDVFSFINDGGDPQPSVTPEAFASFIRADMAKWDKVVREAGIKPVQ